MIPLSIRCGAVALAALFAAVSFADTPGIGRTKLIGHGWDILASSPEELVENAEAFAKSGLDGVAVVLGGVKADGKRYNMRGTTVDTGWTKEMIAPHIPALQQLPDLPGLSESLIMAWVAPRKRLAWTDDAAWANFAHNLGILAWASAKSGLKGLIIDNEDYPGSRQWYYDAEKDGPDYDAACALSRKRGAEIGSAVFAEHPTARLLFFWILSEHRPYFNCKDPVVEKRRIGDLWPAFVDGILDVIPEGAMLVDGDEHAYFCDADSHGFYRHAWNVRQGALALLAPENRGKYAQHVSVSGGLYLDMYVNADTKGCWYFGPGADGLRVSKFGTNLSQAMMVAGEYVWIYGEKHMLIDWKRDAPHAGAGKDRRFAKIREEGRPTWNDVLPGFTASVRAITDGERLARETLSADAAAGFAGEQLPKGKWGFWQHERQSHGTRSVDAADVPFAGCEPSLVASNVTRGCYIKNVPTSAGRLYAVCGYMKGRGGITVTWESLDGKLTTEERNYALPFAAEGDGWQYAEMSVRVPPGVKTLVVHPGMSHRKDAGEVTKFAGIRVVEIRR